MEEETRQCVSCKRFLPAKKFKGRASTGRQAGTSQTTCHRCFYVLYTRPSIERKYERIRALKVERGCKDCGYNAHHAALEFDHLPGFTKSFNISERAGSYSMERLLEEIAKCDVVCANCHNIRTHERRVPVGIPGEDEI